MGIIKMKYVMLFLVLAVVRGTDAATYVVGDSLGWTIPSGGAATYATWAAKHTYALGDILVFNFTAGVHDVATVMKASFDSCSSTSPLALQTISPANVTLTTAGAHYFICTFGKHCSLGQKLSVNVTSTSAGPSTSPSASPPKAATPPPTAATPPPTAPTPTAPTPTQPPTAASPTTPPTAASPTTPPTAASPTTPPTAASPTTPPTAAGPVTTPAASPTPRGSAPVPSPGGGGGPTPPPSPSTTTPPAPSTSPPPTGETPSPPPPSSASRKAVATSAIGVVLVVMGVVC